MNTHAILTEVETHHGDFWLSDACPRIQFKTLRKARSATKAAGCKTITEKSLKGVVLELRLTSNAGWQPRVQREPRAQQEASAEPSAGRARWRRNLEISAENAAEEVERARDRLAAAERRYVAPFELLAEAD